MFVKVKSVPEVVDNVEHVIASLPVTVNVIVADVEVASVAAKVTVGAVVSMVTLDALALELGPVLPAVSVTPFAARRKTTVPSELQTTATVIEVPEDAFGVNAHELAVPVLLKSADTTPLTDSLNTNVYESVLDVEGELGSVHEAVGAAVSIIIALAPAILFDPVGTVVDVIAFPAVSATVPIVNELTVKSDDVSPACTVYVPVKLVPAEAAVNITVRPVSSVTVSVFPD